MHHCLKITEILVNICEHCADNLPAGHTLLSVAIACKYFLEPSLDILWRDQKHLINLVKTFPADAWQSMYHGISFTRPLLASDWERFEYYAPRVRYLEHCVCSSSLPFIDSTVHRAMASHRPLPLLVNLQHLMFDGLKTCLPFFSPKLSRLSIVDFSGISSVNCIASIKTLVPNLEHLSTSGFVQSAQTVCELVCSLYHLRSLNVIDIPVTSACITHLSTLPNLRQLSVGITAESRIQTASSCNLFPALVGLGLSADSWPLVHDFLTAYIQDLPLQNFSCRVKPVATPERLDQLFATLRNYLPNSMRGIVLSRPPHWDYPCALPVLNPNSICRLLTFPNIEKLAILTPISYEDVDNTLIGEIASASPRLTSLEFPFFKFATLTSEAKVTLCGLRPLADHCPNLETLAIGLDPAVPDTHVRLRPDGTFYDTSLAFLSVGHSQIEDPVAVASFLADLFPNLSRVETWDDEMLSAGEIEDKWDEGTYAYLWDKVNTLHRALVVARRQERLHTSQSDGRWDNDSC